MRVTRTGETTEETEPRSSRGQTGAGRLQDAALPPLRARPSVGGACLPGVCFVYVLRDIKKVKSFRLVELFFSC